MTDKEKGTTEFWAPLFEKAYAKLHNGYDALDGGRPVSGIVDLTNGISELIMLSGPEFDEMLADGSFWRKLVEAAERKDLMSASSMGTSDTNKSDLGIVEGHAYSVLDA